MKSLKDYQAVTGRIPTPGTYYNCVRLGDWVEDQRRCYRAGRLSFEQMKELENLKGWSWRSRNRPDDEEDDDLKRNISSIFDDCDEDFIESFIGEDPPSDGLTHFRDVSLEWWDMFDELDLFYSRNGILPFAGYLADWVDEQQANRNILDDIQVAALERQTFWKWNDGKNTNNVWTRWYERLCSFYRIKKCVPILNTAFEGHALGRWFSAQCKEYKKKQMNGRRREKFKYFYRIWKAERDLKTKLF